jgi:cyclopropane fatty-acyl-phospholipid synthase-like methyltransferase
MRMNSAPGKEILALVREGNYAHPGEERAIDLAFESLPLDSGRQVLDIGCGRGGTADYVRRHGWGTVTGIDIDAETLASARELYPEVAFAVADAGRIGELWNSRFDLIYLFNAFYAFPDQQLALREMHAAAKPGASLMIFDYTGRDGSPHDSGTWPLADGSDKRAPFSHQGWTPLHPQHFPEELRCAGWQLERTVDFSTNYLQWYRQLCDRIRNKREQILSGYGQEWYDYVLTTYQELFDSVENGTIGGAAYWARRV